MENLKSIEIKDISKYKKEIINNKLVITQTINNLEQYEQELDQDNVKKLNTSFNSKKIPRNSLCPCGSRKKYKHCHGA